MNQFQTVMEFFRQIPVGTFITRKMYMDAFKGEIRPTMLDNYRCLLMRANFILDPVKDRQIMHYKRERSFPCGVYFIQKSIPNNLTSTKLTDLAYPSTIEQRKRNKILNRQFKNGIYSVL